MHEYAYRLAVNVMDSGQTKLVGLLFIAIIFAGAAITLLVVLEPNQEPENQDQDNSAYYVTVIGGNGTAINVTLDEMFDMTTISRNSSYQNTYGNIRGEGIYTGVKVADLIDMVGGMDEEDTIRVVAGDGYTQLFEFAKVYPNQTYWDIQGDMVLAYEYDNLTVPDYTEGFRLTFLPEDGYYSNADANATTDPNPSAAGPQWVSNVTKIQVLPYSYSESINLVESELRTLPATNGEGGYVKKDGTIIGPFNFTGVKITYLLDQLEDLPDSYIVTGRSTDGYSVTYSKANLYGEVSGYNATGYPVDVINSTLIVAYDIDGGPITDDGPLWIVFLNQDGNLTDGNQWIKGAASITIMEVSPQTSASYTNETDSKLSIQFEIITGTESKFDWVGYMVRTRFFL